MRQFFTTLVLSAAALATLPADAGNCANCGVVAPAGWKLCQRCKNEKERLEREEQRKKRKAEAEAARREKEAAEREAKLKSMIEQQPAANAPAAQNAAPAPKSAAPARPLSEVFPGLFGVQFGQRPDESFRRKSVVEEGRTVERHFFTPAKPFRGFAEYSARSGADGIYEIVAHRRFMKSQDSDAKQAANAEFDDCEALLGKKFGKPMTSVSESLTGRSSQIRFVSSEGIVCRTVMLKLERSMDSALAARYDDEPDSLMAEMDRIYDVWIVATDNIALLREQRAKDANDLDAL